MKSIIKISGLFYHTDETMTDLLGPFLTHSEAKASLIRYCRQNLEGKDTPTVRWFGDNYPT